MTPAEVIAMRDKLSEYLAEFFGTKREPELAEKLIKLGWVTAPPKNEGGNNA